MSSLIPEHSGLYTDLYELTMGQGFFLSGMAEKPASFDYYFRQAPFKGGYVVFAGLSDLLEALEGLSFGEEDLRYLKSLKFQDGFLEYLRNFRFKGSLFSAREGEIVFPQEPVVRVEGTLFEAQLIETLLLNFLNFESLIATKASRMVLAARGRRIVDFGLRRAQGLGGTQASRAAAIGGAEATSNVYAARLYSLTPSGTQAHSWIQGFPDELTAFRRFAEIYPDHCVLLVDTYNTLKSGVPNAITVAKELEKKGRKLAGIRLDSGDLAYLSKRSRELLDEAGLHQVKIIASNQLDESLIKSLLDQGAPINAFGVGTQLVTGQDSPALDGVYKLCLFDGQPSLKISENTGKTSLPGRKKIVRYTDPDGFFYADGVLLEDEKNIEYLYHPLYPEQKSRVAHCFPETILYKVMEGGKTLTKLSVGDAAAYAKERLAKLSPESKRFENPHTYKVGISHGLMEARDSLVQRHLQDGRP